VGRGFGVRGSRVILTMSGVERPTHPPCSLRITRIARIVGPVLPPAGISPQGSAKVRDIRSSEQGEAHAQQLTASSFNRPIRQESNWCAWQVSVGKRIVVEQWLPRTSPAQGAKQAKQTDRTRESLQVRIGAGRSASRS
jgi:hypothetical protein